MAKQLSPVEVGTRGTVASLLSQEIDYYLHSLSHEKFSSPHKQKTPNDNNNNNKKKKNKKNKVESSGKFLPSICNAVEIVETGRAERITRVGYKNLREIDGQELFQE